MTNQFAGTIVDFMFVCLFNFTLSRVKYLSVGEAYQDVSTDWLGGILLQMREEDKTICIDSYGSRLVFLGQLINDTMLLFRDVTAIMKFLVTLPAARPKPRLPNTHIYIYVFELFLS